MPSRVQVLEEQTGELQRQLMLTQSELKAAREDAHIHELSKSQLQAQLAGKSNPAAARHKLHTFIKALQPYNTLNHSCSAHDNAHLFTKGLHARNWQCYFSALLLPPLGCMACYIDVSVQHVSWRFTVYMYVFKRDKLRVCVISNHACCTALLSTPALQSWLQGVANTVMSSECFMGGTALGLHAVICI